MKTSYSSLPISQMKDQIYHRGSSDSGSVANGSNDGNSDGRVVRDTHTRIKNSSSSSSRSNNSISSNIGDGTDGKEYFVDEELGGESSAAVLAVAAATAAPGKKKSKKKKKKKKNVPSNTAINHVDTDSNTNNRMGGNQTSNFIIGSVIESTTNNDNIVVATTNNNIANNNESIHLVTHDENNNNNDDDDDIIDSTNNSNDDDSSNASSSSSTSSDNDVLCFSADSYTLLAIFSPFNKPLLFGFGCLVLVIQSILLVLMVLNVVDKQWSTNESGNPDANSDGTFLEIVADFVPPNVSPVVRATQFVSFICYLLFTDSTIGDWVKSIELWPDATLATNNDQLWYMRVSSFCRFCQATTAITVTFFLVVTSPTAVDIILNFTA